MNAFMITDDEIFKLCAEMCGLPEDACNKAIQDALRKKYHVKDMRSFIDFVGQIILKAKREAK